MTFDEMLTRGQSYYEDNEEEFISAIEELDSWNGYLGDDRIYAMYDLDDLHCGMKLSEFLDKIGDFNSSHDYWYYDGCGKLNSCEYKDYSDHLDKSFIEDLYENQSHLYLDDGIKEIFDEYDNQEEEDEDDE